MESNLILLPNYLKLIKSISFIFNLILPIIKCYERYFLINFNFYSIILSEN